MRRNRAACVSVDVLLAASIIAFRTLLASSPFLPPPVVGGAGGPAQLSLGPLALSLARSL